jgi:putative endonuclease
MLHKRAKGNKGEDIACLYLKRHGFDIVARNYQKKWGELDMVARKDGLIHFFEVKSVTAMYAERFFDAHRPEDNVHGLKRRHIGRMIETYLSEREGGLDVEFHFHVLCVYMDLNTHRASVKWVKNVIL